MLKPSLLNNGSGVISRRDNGVHTFPKDISPKVNVITWLEYELVYYDIAVQHVSRYTTV